MSSSAALVRMPQASTSSSEMSVAMFAVPAMGHVLPLCSLAEELVKRGHAVSFYVLDVFEADHRSLVERTGSTCRLIPTAFVDKHEAGIPPKDIKKFLAGLRQAREHLVREWRSSRPSVAVGDMFSSVLFEAAHALSVPVVMNGPLPLSLLRDLCLLADPASAFTAAGFTFQMVRWSMMSFLFTFMPPLDQFGRAMRRVASTGLVLVNSFHGLEPHSIMPTNWVMTGPLAAPEEERLQGMAREYPRLAAWLEAAADEGQPVAYVSTGTMKELTEWETRTLYEGLQRAPCKVVWSLRKESQGFLPHFSQDRFWVAAWLPQPAILAHRATKLCISHCGWGGSMEAIAAGVPVFAMPFGADQPENARLLVKAGAALMLPKREPPLSLTPKLHEYVRGDFSAETVSSGVVEMLTETAYAHNMSRLQALAAAAGGRKAACNSIEWLVRCSTLSCLGTNPFDNPLLRRIQGHWSDFIVVPLACMAAIAGLCCFAKISRLSKT